ncbi:MAG: hypothetical protein PPP55_13025, partial [Halorubrum sp.]
RGARVGPEGEAEQSARWQRAAMRLDEDVSYSDAELDHAVAPVDPDEPWEEPDDIGEAEKREGRDASGSQSPNGVDGDETATDSDRDTDTADGGSDQSESLTDFAN